MHQRKSKKILLYFFLFLIIGSLNNKNLINRNLTEINQISVKGLDKKNNQKLEEDLNYLKLTNIYFLKKQKIIETINSNNLVESYFVYKNYPSTIEIKIDKTEFLAQIKKDNKIFLFGSNGKLIKSEDIKNDIPFIFGDFSAKSFFKLKNIIDNSNLEYNEIENFFYFKSGRWDIETINGLLIKLPKKNVKKSFKLLNDIIKNDEKNKITKIDLRQLNQIIIDE
tara:strand:+ start:59 stop:730 length:672 start_codon:yes stop_codon:yes gene_type:complete